MKGKYLILGIICIMLTFTSCIISGEKLKQLTPNSKFDTIRIFNNIEVVMTPGENVSYLVSGSDRAKTKLRIGIEGDALAITAAGLRGSEKLSVYLTAPMPGSIHTFNNASFALDGSADTKDLELEAWNSSIITINQNITAKEVSVSAFNNSKIDIKSVVADNLNIEAANNAIINISGKVKYVTKSVMNGAVVNTEHLSDTLSEQSHSHDDSTGTVIVYNDHISLLGRLFN